MDKSTLIECHERISPYIHRTPVLTSKSIDEIIGAQIVFKCENFQKMGAFKMRGATNAILNLSKENKKKGVVTHSSGNFAQALALAAKSVGVKAYIVMPSNAPDVKIKAVEGYGGNIMLCEPTLAAREFSSYKISNETGATFIHPSNDINVIVGNSTSALELLQNNPDLEYIVTPVGGGGLIAGTALAASFFGNQIKVIGAEPKEVDDAFRSLKSGKIEFNDSTDTIADGLKTNLGDVNFPIIQKLVDEIILVDESEIMEAMKVVYERLKIVIEPSSATALAAVFKEKQRFKNRKIGVILSGGNVDLSKLKFA